MNLRHGIINVQNVDQIQQAIEQFFWGKII